MTIFDESRKWTTVYWAPDKATLVTALKPVAGGQPCLHIALSCGHVREWAWEDVPETSVQCRCGELDYEHWFIQYGNPRPEPAPGVVEE